MSVPSEPALGEERETGYEHSKSQCEREKLPQASRQTWTAEIPEIVTPVEQRETARKRLILVRRRGRQQQRGADDASGRERRRCEDRVLITVRRQNARYRRTDKESQPERNADDAERAGALFGSRDVGNIRLRKRKIPGGEPVDDAGHEHQPQ